MVQQYTQEEFESFMKSMKKMSDIVCSEKPDYIFAPIIGSIPLIDILAIANRHFPLENVEYPPNSSRFLKRSEIINKWYTNFINSNYTGEKMSIICIDEVISGSSATKGYQEFQKVLHDLNKKHGESLEKKVRYNILGIGEQPKKGKRNSTFIKLMNKKKAKVLETQRIITADNINLNPIRLRKGKINSQGRQTYLPEIESINYSEDYLNFLYNTGVYFGANPEQINPASMLKIKGSLDRYLKQL